MSTNIEIDMIQNINLNNKDENFVISPTGIEIVLSLISNGAQGDTQIEILKLLNYKDLKEANTISKYLIEQSRKDQNTLSIATAILTKILASEEFIRIGTKDYDAKVEELKNYHQVNIWAKVKTKDNIVKIIDSISPNVLMVLVNAIYFEAMWQTKFDPKNNIDKDFYNLGNEYNQVKASMLFYRGKLLNYYENDEIQAVKLNYDEKAKSIKAIIILPKQKDIDTFIQDFTAQKYDEIIEGLKKETKVNFYLPKFEVEFKIEMNDILRNLGIHKAFTKDADFKLLC
jgi:serpin B